MSAKLLTFALAKRKDRDLAQLVAHTSGGREVAGSSPVIPTKRNAKSLYNDLAFFYFLIPLPKITFYQRPELLYPLMVIV